MFGFFNPSLEEREWLISQNKKLWFLMPLAFGGVLFWPTLTSLVVEGIWGILIINVLMRYWIHRAFSTRDFRGVVWFKIADTVTNGLVLGWMLLFAYSVFSSGT